MRKDNRFSKTVVTLVIALNVLFTASVLYVFLRVGHEPTALITAWFAFTTGELWMLAGITKTKVKQAKKEERMETEDQTLDYEKLV